MVPFSFNLFSSGVLLGLESSDKLYRCYKCKRADIEYKEMAVSNGKVRGVCKKCRCIEEKERRARKGKEKLSDDSKIYYRRYRERLALLDESNPEDLDKLINTWISKNVSRTTENRFKMRRGLNLENLKRLCYKAIEMFPYISFKNTRDNYASNYKWASIDRVNPELPYTDDNIIVVPLWLNSAKLNTSYETIFDVFQSLDTKKFIEFLGNERLTLQ